MSRWLDTDLVSVSPAGVDALARYYWIDEIVPPEESTGAE